MKIEPLSRLLSGFLSAFKHNSNADKIEEAFQNTLSRDGSSPNFMEANLDMNSNRIINLGAPVNASDAVRLQDVIDLGNGELTIGTNWSDIVDKPDTFPPSVHSHTSSDIADFGEAVQDQIGAHVVGGTNITVTYDDVSGDTTINATGSLAGDWNTLANKPSTFTPSAHTHAQTDVTGLTTALSGKANTSHTHTLSDITDYVAGASGFVRLEDFGGNGNGVFDNATAFASAEASSNTRVYLGSGVYKTSASGNSITYSKYWGPGRILFGTSYRPARYVNLLTKPTSGTGVDLDFFYSGDTTKMTDVGYYKFGTAASPLRIGLNETYYDAVTVPHFEFIQSFQGYSGLTAFTTNTITTGATTVNLDLSGGGTIDDLPVGRVFAFATQQDGTQVHTATSQGVSGSTLTFTPAIPSGVTIPAGYAVMIGKRTHHSHFHARSTHAGGGDFIQFFGSISNEYKPSKGQTHVFNGATAGWGGGGIALIYDGQYATGVELLISAESADAAGIGYIINLNRNNDTGARGAVWIGYVSKSEGTKAANAGYSVIGKHTVGIDLVLGDFGTNKAAMAMKLGDRIHFDNTVTPKIQYSLTGDTFPTNAMYIGSDLISGVKVIDLNNGAYRLRLKQDGGMTTNTSFTVGGSMLVGSYVQSQSGAFYLQDNTTGLTFDGTTIRLIKHGVTVASW
jgi:hypothetical protein